MAPPELIPGGVPLTSVPGLNAVQIHTLNDIWINTAQELIGIYGTNEPTRSRLSAALGIQRVALDPVVNAAQRLIPLTRAVFSVTMELEAAETEYSLGAFLDEPDVVQKRHRSLPPYEGVFRAPLPDSHSLLEQLPPLRNQGRRGTCVAHAALSVREQLEIAAGAPHNLDLSEQYVYWWCKEHDGLPWRSGTFLSLGMRCLVEMGAPLEALWPYVNAPRSDQGQGPPPESAAGGDPAFRTAQTQEFNRIDLVGMKTCLVEGRSIAVALPVYESWYKSSAMARWGKITLPLTGEPVREGHAVTLVGYQDDARAPGGGYFLVRNSWQPWAWDGVWAPGTGYLPYAYITHHGNTIFSARRLQLTGAALYLRDRADANGETQAGASSWNSPDIWLRQRADAGVEPQMPAPGQENALYVRVFNRGPACAYRVAVDVLYAPAASDGLRSFDCAPRRSAQDGLPIGRLRAPMLWPGDTILGPLMWTPPGPGPFALLARVAGDTPR